MPDQYLTRYASTLGLRSGETRALERLIYGPAPPGSLIRRVRECSLAELEKIASQAELTLKVMRRLRYDGFCTKTAALHLAAALVETDELPDILRARILALWGERRLTGRV
jgi:hypothetical protein